MENLFKTLEYLFFPKRCFGCGEVGTYLCPFCEGKISYLTSFNCIVCGKKSIDGFTHRKCASRFTPDRLISAFEYSGVVRKALVNAKYNQKAFSIYERFVELAFEHFEEFNIQIGRQALFIPIPVSWKKFRDRTFNHSEVISEYFAKRYGASVACALRKIKKTRSQSRLRRRDRKENVKGVFEVKKAFADKVKGKDVVLVDDVCTTGATLLSASKVLRGLGKKSPRYIYCLTLAYDLPPYMSMARS